MIKDPQIPGPVITKFFVSGEKPDTQQLTALKGLLVLRDVGLLSESDVDALSRLIALKNEEATEQRHKVFKDLVEGDDTQPFALIAAGIVLRRRAGAAPPMASPAIAAAPGWVLCLLGALAAAAARVGDFGRATEIVEEMEEFGCFGGGVA